jgi:hypothetical protein
MQDKKKEFNKKVETLEKNQIEILEMKISINQATNSV